MGEVTKTLTIYLASRDEDIDIEVDCEYEVENNGIGSYEYWGQKCFDKGTDCAVIVGTEWDKTGFSPEEIALIESKIEVDKNEWAGEIEIEPDEPDFDPCDRG